MFTLLRPFRDCLNKTIVFFGSSTNEGDLSSYVLFYLEVGTVGLRLDKWLLGDQPPLLEMFIFL